MATLIQELSCHQKHPGVVPYRAMSPLLCKGSRHSNELPSQALVASSHKKYNITDMMSSKACHLYQENCEASMRDKGNIHDRSLQLTPNSTRDSREEKTKKRRSNRDSIFSFMSIISRSDDGKFIERKNTQRKQEVSSPVYSQTSFLSSSSTIDIPSQVHPQNIKIPSNIHVPVCISRVQSRSSMPSPLDAPLNLKNINHIEDSLKRTDSQLRSDKCQNNNHKGEEEINDSDPEQDKQGLNFFQEQQEQEYRIAKAWLEAEESRKTTSRSALGSGSTECSWDDAWIRFSGSENSRLMNDPIVRDVHNNRTKNHNRFKSKAVLDKCDVGVSCDEVITTTLDTTDKVSTEGKQNNVKRKRISGMASLAIGVTSWLSRRVRSN